MKYYFQSVLFFFILSVYNNFFMNIIEKVNCNVYFDNSFLLLVIYILNLEFFLNRSINKK